MKASLKTLIVTALLSSGAVMAGSAHAEVNRSNPYVNGYGHAPASVQVVVKYDHPDYRVNNANTWRYIDQRQVQQRARIDQGIRSGELTPMEAQRLIGEQREIERMQRAYMADNRLSPFERQRLMNELDEASNDIWNQKHDAQARPTFRPPWFAYR